jgi:predicted RND superfamily exporter protein
VPIFAHIARWILRHRVVTGLLLALIVGVAGVGSSRVVADFSVEAFFGADDHEVTELAAYKELWGDDDSIMILVIRAEEGTVLDPSRLAVLEDLVATLDAAPEIQSTLSLVDAPALLGEQAGMIELRSVIETRPDDSEDTGRLNTWRKRVLSNTAMVPLLLSADARSASVILHLDVDADDVKLLAPIVEAVRDVVAPFSGREGLWVGTAGIPAVRADFFKLIFEDQLIVMPAVMGLGGLLLLLLFRRFHGMFIPGFAALLPTFMVFGAMGFVGEPIGIMNQNYATLLPAIMVADAIHLVSRFHEEARRLAGPGQLLTPAQRRTAIVAATERIGLACLLTSATTGIGFLSLELANMPILRSYGAFAALGIGAAYGTVLLVIPLMLSFTRGAVPGHERGNLSRVNRMLERCARGSLRHPWWVLGATGAVLVISLVLSTRVVIDNELTGMLEDGHPTNIANELVDHELGGMLGIEVETSGPGGSLKSPEVIAALAALESWAAKQDGVRAVQGPVSLLRLFSRATRATDELPATRDAIAQTFLLGESGGLDRFVLLGGSEGVEGYARSRTVLRVEDRGGLWIDGFSTRLQEQLDTLFDGLSTRPHITGTAFVAYRGINRVTDDLHSSLALAFLIIAVIILLLFRSVRIAILCIIPNAMPLVVGYGLMGATGWILDPAPAVIFIIAMGIAVDDTIHLVVRWREELAAGHSNHEAIVGSVVHTGRAVLVTTIVLATGFGVNVLSSFPIMRVVALLGATVVTTALICDLFVLPALLGLWGEKAGKEA